MKRWTLFSLFVLLAAALSLSCGETGETGTDDGSNNGGKGDISGDECSLDDGEERNVVTLERNGTEHRQCRGPDGRFVENACCPELATDPSASFTDAELSCLCFQDLYNNCLLEAGDDAGAVNECVMIIEDTLEDDTCCEEHGEILSVLCIPPEDGPEADPQLADIDLSCEADDPDTDGDGVSDANDNCPNVSNADQTDSDSNGIGDACQPTEAEELNACLCMEKDYNECLIDAGDDFGAINECVKMVEDTLEDDNCCDDFPDDLSVLCEHPADVEADEQLAEEQADLVCQ